MITALWLMQICGKLTFHYDNCHFIVEVKLRQTPIYRRMMGGYTLDQEGVKIALNNSFFTGCYKRKLKHERLCGQIIKFIVGGTYGIRSIA
jgi:hypothetical protein